MSLLIAATEVQSVADGRWLDIVEGGRFSVPAYRGINTVVPGLPGQVARPHVADHLRIRLHGTVWGDGATPALRRASFATRMSALLTALGDVGDEVTLTANPPNEALATGQTATITAQFERVVLGPPQGWEHQEIDIDFLCIEAPDVGWLVA